MKIRITWDPRPASENVAQYNIYQSVPGGPNNKIATVAANVSPLAYEIPSPAPGTYNFQVRAENLAGEGAPSSTVSTGGAPGVPANVQVQVLSA